MKNLKTFLTFFPQQQQSNHTQLAFFKISVSARTKWAWFPSKDHSRGHYIAVSR